MVDTRLTTYFKDETELFSLIERYVEVKASANVASLERTDKPFGCVTAEQLNLMISVSGIEKGVICYKLGVPRSTFSSWLGKPSSLTLDNFKRIAAICASACNGDPAKEDAFYDSLVGVLQSVSSLSAEEEREAMREAAIRRISDIAPNLSDADLATLLDIAVSLHGKGDSSDNCNTPASWPLREASDALRKQREESERERMTKKLKKLTNI